jgi:hypothetical protein
MCALGAVEEVCGAFLAGRCGAGDDGMSGWMRNACGVAEGGDADAEPD